MKKEIINPMRLAALLLIVIFAALTITACEMSSPSYCWDCGEPLKVVEEASHEGFVMLYYQCTKVPSHKFGISEKKPKEKGE